MLSASQIKEMQKAELERLLEWVGSNTRLASDLGVDKSAVSHWVKRGRISASAAIEVERLTKGAFKKEELRPDVTSWSK